MLVFCVARWCICWGWRWSLWGGCLEQGWCNPWRFSGLGFLHLGLGKKPLSLWASPIHPLLGFASALLFCRSKVLYPWHCRGAQEYRPSLCPSFEIGLLSFLTPPCWNGPFPFSWSAIVSGKFQQILFPHLFQHQKGFMSNEDAGQAYHPYEFLARAAGIL